MGEKEDKAIILAKNHDLVVNEETAECQIGGTQCTYKRFTVKKSKEMEEYLNKQSLIKAAAPRVDQKVIDEAMNGLKTVVDGSKSNKKLMKALAGPIMKLFVSPDPEVIFGGPTDTLVDKKIATGAVMTRIQKEIPSVIPSLFMNNFFDDDDDENETGPAPSGNGDRLTLGDL